MVAGGKDSESLSSYTSWEVFGNRDCTRAYLGNATLLSTPRLTSFFPTIPSSLLSLSSRDVPLSTGRPYNGRSISTDPDVQSNCPRVYILYHRSVYQVIRPSEGGAERSSADPVVLPFSLPSVSFSSSNRIHPTSPASSSFYVSAS